MYFNRVAALKAWIASKETKTTVDVTIDISNFAEEIPLLCDLLSSGVYPDNLAIHFAPTESFFDEHIVKLNASFSPNAPRLMFYFDNCNWDTISIKPFIVSVSQGRIPYGSTVSFEDCYLFNDDLICLTEAFLSPNCSKWLTIELQQKTKNHDSMGLRVEAASQLVSKNGVASFIDSLKQLAPIGLMIKANNLGTESQRQKITTLCYDNILNSFALPSSSKDNHYKEQAIELLAEVDVFRIDRIKLFLQNHLATLDNEILPINNNQFVMAALRDLVMKLTAKRNELSSCCYKRVMLPKTVLKAGKYLTIRDIVDEWKDALSTQGSLKNYEVVSRPRGSWRVFKSGPPSAQQLIDDIVSFCGDLKYVNVPFFGSVSTNNTKLALMLSPSAVAFDDINLDEAQNTL
ncbi:MAG: hypothetical protein Q8R83_07365 [Legionellaceae bacterium]|nr:hypothetical protein [Legionellaceae bacterium]